MSNKTPDLNPEHAVQVIMDKRLMSWLTDALPSGLTLAEVALGDGPDPDTFVVLPSPEFIRQMECPIRGGCHSCAMPTFTMGMRLCPDCGNKRCPHIAHHAYQCTHSNEPNQEPTYADGTPVVAPPPDPAVVAAYESLRDFILSVDEGTDEASLVNRVQDLRSSILAGDREPAAGGNHE